VFENRVLRRIFGPKKEEVAGEHCIMRSYITCILHQIETDQVKENEMDGHVACVGEKNLYKIFIGKLDGRR
jgi:hypothetical protein